MDNLYDIVKESLYFNKFVINELVCVEYTCPLEDEQLGIFTEHDYIIHVLSGEKTWRTIDGKWTLKEGDTLYVKKGASIITQHLEEDFCMLAFFIPDYIIRSSLAGTPFTAIEKLSEPFTATMLHQAPYLRDFFQSMLTYFKKNEQPPESIVETKIKELILNIAYQSNHPSLISYLNSVLANNIPSLNQIMKSNFCYNLSLKEFAKLSHRSLSTFKRDFKDHYQTSPGKWLLAKRLEFAANLLLSSVNNISQTAFESGFEDVSHFSRVFKSKFGVPPSDYRK